MAFTARELEDEWRAIAASHGLDMYQAWDVLCSKYPAESQAYLELRVDQLEEEIQAWLAARPPTG